MFPLLNRLLHFNIVCSKVLMFLGCSIYRKGVGSILRSSSVTDRNKLQALHSALMKSLFFSYAISFFTISRNKRERLKLFIVDSVRVLHIIHLRLLGQYRTTIILTWVKFRSGGYYVMYFGKFWYFLETEKYFYFLKKEYLKGFLNMNNWIKMMWRLRTGLVTQVNCKINSVLALKCWDFKILMSLSNNLIIIKKTCIHFLIKRKEFSAWRCEIYLFGYWYMLRHEIMKMHHNTWQSTHDHQISLQLKSGESRDIFLCLFWLVKRLVWLKMTKPFLLNDLLQTWEMNLVTSS